MASIEKGETPVWPPFVPDPDSPKTSLLTAPSTYIALNLLLLPANEIEKPSFPSVIDAWGVKRTKSAIDLEVEGKFWSCFY